MIGDALRVEIERYAERARSENALLSVARRGMLSARDLGRYLTSVRHLLRHTPVHLQKARDSALQQGQPALAEYFHTKLGEETGHDEWAENDLEELATRFDVPSETEVMPAVDELVSRLDRVTSEQPVVYLAYVLFAEYHVVLLGPEWLSLVEERCHVPQSMLSAVGHHVELDKEHVAEGIAEIDALVDDPAMLPALREMLWTAMDCFERFCAEVVERSDRAPEMPVARTAHA